MQHHLPSSAQSSSCLWVNKGTMQCNSGLVRGVDHVTSRYSSPNTTSSSLPFTQHACKSMVRRVLTDSFGSKAASNIGPFYPTTQEKEPVHDNCPIPAVIDPPQQATACSPQVKAYAVGYIDTAFDDDEPFFAVHF